MLVILAVVVISAFTVVGAAYAKRFERADGLMALYVLFAALSQVMAAKIATYDFVLFQVTAPAAVLVFAVTFLITDVVNEKFGRHEVHRMVFLTFVTQVAMVVFLFIGSRLPAAPFWDGQASWDRLFGMVPRITVASWVTFLVSENLDAWLFAVVRRTTRGRYLWARNVISSVVSLSVDTVVFVTLAFAGTGVPVWQVMVGQFCTKYLVALVDIPFMYLNRAFLGKRLVRDESAE